MVPDRHHSHYLAPASPMLACERHLGGLTARDLDESAELCSKRLDVWARRAAVGL
jgi:hypothetical protein